MWGKILSLARLGVRGLHRVMVAARALCGACLPRSTIHGELSIAALLLAAVVVGVGCFGSGSPTSPGGGGGGGTGGGGGGGTGGSETPRLDIVVGRSALQSALASPDEPLSVIKTTVTFQLHADSTYFAHSVIYLTGRIRGDTAPNGWVRNYQTGFDVNGVGELEFYGTTLPENVHRLEPAVTTDWNARLELVDQNYDTDTTLVYEPAFSLVFLRPKARIDLEVYFDEYLGEFHNKSFSAIGGGTYPTSCDSIVRNYWTSGGAASVDSASSISGCLAQVRYDYVDVGGELTRYIAGLAVDWDQIGKDVPIIYCPPDGPCVHNEITVPLTYPDPDSLLPANGSRQWNFITSGGMHITNIHAMTRSWY